MRAYIKVFMYVGKDSNLIISLFVHMYLRKYIHRYILYNLNIANVYLLYECIKLVSYNKGYIWMINAWIIQSTFTPSSVTSREKRHHISAMTSISWGWRIERHYMRKVVHRPAAFHAENVLFLYKVHISREILRVHVYSMIRTRARKEGRKCRTLVGTYLICMHLYHITIYLRTDKLV